MRRHFMNAVSLNLLAKTTVVKNESRQDFQALVRHYTPCIAPRNAIALEYLVHARGPLAGALIGDPEPADPPAPNPFRILPSEAS